mmetsp:Transcript_11659/g.30380  ORF Transcript_11659/g.30380 Transcript_11659/m.30380 type:complete len:218 (+) Transcript_11659:12-665(+)
MSRTSDESYASGWVAGGAVFEVAHVRWLAKPLTANRRKSADFLVRVTYDNYHGLRPQPLRGPQPQGHAPISHQRLALSWRRRGPAAATHPRAYRQGISPGADSLQLRRAQQQLSAHEANVTLPAWMRWSQLRWQARRAPRQPARSRGLQAEDRSCLACPPPMPAPSSWPTAACQDLVHSLCQTPSVRQEFRRPRLGMPRDSRARRHTPARRHPDRAE